MSLIAKPEAGNRIWTILPAAGVGRRMQSELPKQYLPLLGKTIIEQTLALFLQHPRINDVVLVLDPQDSYWPKLALAQSPRIRRVEGGAERCDSVLNALKSIAGEAQAEDWVLVHDVARPCLRSDDLDRLLAELASHPVGGLLGVPVADTLKRANAAGEVEATLDRRQVWRAFTPQMFRYGLLVDALSKALERQLTITDEASAIEAAGLNPKMVEGHGDNIKVTLPGDLLLAELFLRQIRAQSNGPNIAADDSFHVA